MDIYKCPESRIAVLANQKSKSCKFLIFKIIYDNVIMATEEDTLWMEVRCDMYNGNNFIIDNMYGVASIADYDSCCCV